MNSRKVIEFTLLYNRYKTRIFNYALRMTNNLHTTEDIVQNVFIKFYENISRLREKEKAQFWLFTTARNEIYSSFRQKKYNRDLNKAVNPDDLETADAESPVNIVENRELREIIISYLDEMPEEQKEVFLLKEYGGLSYKEISKVMNIEEEKIKSRLYMVRQKLIKELSSQMNFKDERIK